MDRRKSLERFSGIEVFLPLFFFNNEEIFYAVALILIAAGATLLLFEFLRNQARSSLFAFYLFWLAALGACGWLAAGLPPYWIWSVYLLVPVSVWEPSDAQRAQPFLMGLKKYFKSRVFELITAFLFAFIFTFLLIGSRQISQGVISWVIILFLGLILEFLFETFRKQKK